MSEIFGTIIKNELTLTVYLVCVLSSLLCGLITAFCASVRSRVSKSFIVCLILLPPIVETVITMVNGNVGTGIAVAGAFSLVRFRSVPGKARDIAAIFLAMTAGLTCAAGYVGIAIIFTLLVGGVMVSLSFIPIGREKEFDLRITVPESLNYTELFDEVFEKYTNKSELLEVKTTNMGSLYKLKYRVLLNKTKEQKEFIDELRIRNGNLEIALCQSVFGNEEL